MAGEPAQVIDYSRTYEQIGRLRFNLEKVILGKTEIIDLVITTLLAKGHLLIEDVPGVGKTTLAHGLARSINCTFHRIQFTSDLLPSDVIGVTIYNQADHTFQFQPGPIFANVILADEINRTTPRTQSALLESMNEGQVTVEKHTHALPEPFMLLATQNPLDYSGTFPLPESQLDRFMMRIRIGYPDEQVEKEIISSAPSVLSPEGLTPVLTMEEVLELQSFVDSVRMEQDIVDYIMAIVTATRSLKGIKLGVSPRGAITLFRAAKAMALIQGRNYCIPDDVKGLAVPVLAHRVIPVHYGIEEGSEDTTVLIEEVLESVTIPV